MKNLKKLIGIISITVLANSLSASSLSEMGEEGKELFNEASCFKCHNLNGDFNKMNNKVKNLENLAGWVSACDNNLNIGWFPDEQKKVVKYLNETYYHLNK